MTSLDLHIPCLVQQQQLDGQAVYHLRPVFQLYPLASHARFDQAMETLSRELKNQLDHYQIDRNSIDHILWFAFDPALEPHKYQLEIQINKRSMIGQFSVYTFQVQQLKFGILPGFDNYLFMLDQESGANVKEQTQAQIEYLLRGIYREEPSEFDFDSYQIPKREFITTIELDIQVNNGSFKYEKTDSNPLARFLQDPANFEGAQEIFKVAENLNSRYPEKLSRAYYRDELVTQLTRQLYSDKAAPIALIGPEGSGRHTLVEEVIFRKMHLQNPEIKTRERTVWKLDPNQVIAGMSYVGWWEKRFEAVLSYLTESKPLPDFLLVDNPLALLRIGRSAQSALNLARLLRPYLEKRDLPLIIIATAGQWKLMQEQDPAFVRQFQSIHVDSVNLELATRIALKKRRWLEKKYHCTITVPAIQEIFKLHRNFFLDQALPGNVVKQLEQLASREPYGYIDLPQVREAFSNLSGWKDQILNEHTKLEDSEIEGRIASQLVGQNHAVAALSGAVHLVKSRLNNPTKPYSSFLFVGPTGVGKTQGAKVLCRVLTGSEKALVRFDMNEYLDGQAAQRLIGTYRQPEGHLTSRVRYQPFCVLLFDEIEKAHPSVVDLLLQVLDDGRLTDSRGRRVDFTNTFIILTSNLGSKEAEGRLGFRTESWNEKDVYLKALRNHFRPEFLNRIDETVVFNPLSENEILGIAQLQIRELLSRDGFVRRTTLLNISPEALEWVAKRGYDPKMGGRALKRQIERDLTRLSADQLIRIPDEHPILLNISLENDQLVPNITSLEFADLNSAAWKIRLPEERKGGPFYRGLIQRLERLEQVVRDVEPTPSAALLDITAATENWQYYHFQNSIAERKERIQTLLLGHRDPNFRESPVLAYRFRSGPVLEKANEAFFRADQLSEFREHYRLGQQQFDTAQSEFMTQHIAVCQLELNGYHFLHSLSEKLTLIIEPCIQGADEGPIEYLYKQYEAWFQFREIPFEANKGNWSFKAEDFGLFDQVKSEEGLHFFYGPFGSPIPIRVRIDRPGANKSNGSADQILRIYDLENTLIDLRSGLANEYFCTPSEWDLLIFSGWGHKTRSKKIKR